MKKSRTIFALIQACCVFVNSEAETNESYGERGCSVNYSLVKLLCGDAQLNGKHVRTIGILGVDSNLEGYLYLTASDFYASNENNAIHVIFNNGKLNIEYNSLKELEGRFVEVAGLLHLPHYVTGDPPRLGDHTWIEKVSFLLAYKAKVPGKRNQWRTDSLDSQGRPLRPLNEANPP